MAHHHQTTESYDPDCPRCREELAQYWADVETAKLRTAAEMVTSSLYGSPSALMRRLGQDHGIRVTFEEAQALLGKLESAGVVGPLDTGTYTHPVLMDHDAALRALGLAMV